jgi:hypothetical protein
MSKRGDNPINQSGSGNPSCESSYTFLLLNIHLYLLLGILGWNHICIKQEEA